MSQSPKRWSIKGAIFAASLSVVFAACGTAATSPSVSAPASTAPSAAASVAASAAASTGASAGASASASSSAAASASGGAFTPMVYPTTGDAPCGVAPYTGEMKKITAIDELTVEFQLCGPDASFLPKVAFSAFDIQDSDYLSKHVPDGTILTQPNGTGPYVFKEWSKGNRIVWTANPNYWGDKAKTPTAELHWSDESAARLLDLQSGTVDGIDNPGTPDIATIKADSTLKFYPRAGLNTLFLGFNNTQKPFDDVRVRQAIAMGIDRDQIVKNFFPEGSTVAEYFTPCEIDFACTGDKSWTFDPTAAKKLLADAGFPDGKGITAPINFRAAVRGYNPNPPVIATEISQQLKKNLGIDAPPTLIESGAMIDGFTQGTLKGLSLIGWGADYPDPSNFLDYHFGSGSGKKFGTPFQDIVDALNKGLATADPAERTAAYATANGLIKQHVPAVIVAHGASGDAFKADVTGAYASVFGGEQLARMQPADRQTVVFEGNAEPLSLFCADESDGESLRACEQTNEALYRYDGAKAVPALATECTASADSKTWTCKLRSGVKFHDGASFDANDVVASYALQWDTKNPLHKGRASLFDYWSGLWGGYLNPKPKS
jgi:peptide/nickel transport system substrate-binding protein